MRRLLFISLLFFPAITFAGGSAPWCLVLDEVEICGFNTAESCYAKAESGGYCRQNAQFLGVMGERPWCVITAEWRHCKYTRAACLRVAAEVGGGCVENTELALKNARAGAAGWGSGSGANEEEDFEFEEGIAIGEGMMGEGMTGGGM